MCTDFTHVPLGLVQSALDTYNIISTHEDSIAWIIPTTTDTIGMISVKIYDDEARWAKADTSIKINPKSNICPTISELSAEYSTLAENDTNYFTCMANDADGDSITYSWSATCGTFVGSTTGFTVTWKAPEITTKVETCYISVCVDDNSTDQCSVCDTIAVAVTGSIIFFMVRARSRKKGA